MHDDELFPPRTGGQVKPEDAVKQVLDTMAAVGWDLRQVMVSQEQQRTFHQPKHPPVGTFREFWRECPGCLQRTRWGFTQREHAITGCCQECDASETFSAWEEVIEVLDER